MYLSGEQETVIVLTDLQVLVPGRLGRKVYWGRPRERPGLVAGPGFWGNLRTGSGCHDLMGLGGLRFGSLETKWWKDYLDIN